METKEEGNIDGANRYRKFGLPNWMMNNIERLNFVTDFEQYACSPPETEGFLSDYVDNSEFHDNTEASCPVVSAIPSEPIDDKSKLSLEIKGISESKSSPSLLESSSPQNLSPVTILSSIKHEDFYSSPDSTPCATPEASPAPRRRMSGQQDTVQTNPGRWFYLGNLKVDQKGQSLNVNSNKKPRIKSNDIPRKLRESPVKTKKDGIKLVISNFDINAISPSSW